MNENIKSEEMINEVLATYEIRVEKVSIGSDSPVIMHSVYAKDGGYVGDVEDVQKYKDLLATTPPSPTSPPSSQKLLLV